MISSRAVCGQCVSMPASSAVMQRWAGAFARLTLIAIVAASVAGCDTLPRNEPPYWYCQFNSARSQAACDAAAQAGNCQVPGQFDAASLDCRGAVCKGSYILVNGHEVWSYCGDPATVGPPKSLVAPDTPDALPSPSGGGSVAGEIDRATRLFREPAAAPEVSVTPKATPLAAASAPSITEFNLPQPAMQPGPIIASDQHIYFTGTCIGCIVYEVFPDGHVTSAGGTCYGPSCHATGLAPVSGGGLCWGLTGLYYNGVRQSDEIDCRVPNQYGSSHALHVINGYVAGLALGADGKIWYADAQLNGIGRLDPQNTFAEQVNYLDPGAQLGLASVASGPDGAMWFTAVYGNQIGRVTASSLDLNAVPTADSQPAGITGGPDGNVWFTEFKGNQIGRITSAGVITEYPLPTANAQPLGITLGPDGALWFTEYGANRIGRITRFGDITEYPVPTANSQPAGIVTGADGNIWFTEFQGNKIGKLTVPPPSASPQAVEFYNSDLDTFFITANAPEAAAIDNGSAGPGWSRTGSTFSAGGSTPVCRFYGSVSPGPNSHFYTVDAAECESLKQLQASTPATQKRWNFESLDFNTTPAVNGACAAGLVPVYRAYNNGSIRGVDSNHRITSSPGAVAEVVKRGWSSEGTVMCAPL